MPQDRRNTYLVEIEPCARAEGPGSIADRARSRSREARFLRSIYVPEDERLFLLYEGASTAEVTAAAERADVRVVSVAVARATEGGR